MTADIFLEPGKIGGTLPASRAHQVRQASHFQRRQASTRGFSLTNQMRQIDYGTGYRVRSGVLVSPRE